MYKKINRVFILALLLAQVAGFVHAEIDQIGSVSAIQSNAASSGGSPAESWTWVQVSGLSAGACSGTDVGSGDLANLALPGTEKGIQSLLLSAYMAGSMVRVVVDDVNLYQGYCQLKSVTLAPNLSSGGGGALIAAAYWRVYITANNGNSYTTMAEMAFYDENGTQLDTSTTSNAIASSYANTSNPDDYAFDGSTLNKWTSAASEMPTWIGYHFPSDVTVGSVLLTSHYSTGDQAASAIKDFKIQWSSDGSTWNDIGSTVTGETTWGAAESRSFAVQ